MTDPRLALFLDRSTQGRRYGRGAVQNISDTQWIAEAPAARYVVSGTNNLRVADMVALFAASLPAIRAHAGEPGPWVLRIARHGVERLPLRCDDARGTPNA